MGKHDYAQLPRYKRRGADGKSGLAQQFKRIKRERDLSRSLNADKACQECWRERLSPIDKRICVAAGGLDSIDDVLPCERD